jgi:molybdopterin-binding protein
MRCQPLFVINLRSASRRRNLPAARARWSGNEGCRSIGGPGTVRQVTKRATTAHVRVDIGGGQIVTSSITNEAIDELGIKLGDSVTVVIKASDVMIAVD